MSFENVRTTCKTATLNQLMINKLALCLFKLYNTDFNSVEFSLLNFNQVITSRQTTFRTIKINRTRIGLNLLTNRLYHINGDVPLELLNLSIGTFKVKCKKNIPVS